MCHEVIDVIFRDDRHLSGIVDVNTLKFGMMLNLISMNMRQFGEIPSFMTKPEHMRSFMKMLDAEPNYTIGLTTYNRLRRILNIKHLNDNSVLSLKTEKPAKFNLFVR